MRVNLVLLCLSLVAGRIGIEPCKKNACRIAADNDEKTLERCTSEMKHTEWEEGMRHVFVKLVGSCDNDKEACKNGKLRGVIPGSVQAKYRTKNGLPGQGAMIPMMQSDVKVAWTAGENGIWKFDGPVGSLRGLAGSRLLSVLSFDEDDNRVNLWPQGAMTPEEVLAVLAESTDAGNLWIELLMQYFLVEGWRADNPGFILRYDTESGFAYGSDILEVGAPDLDAKIKRVTELTHQFKWSSAYHGTSIWRWGEYRIMYHHAILVELEDENQPLELYEVGLRNGITGMTSAYRWLGDITGQIPTEMNVPRIPNSVGLAEIHVLVKPLDSRSIREFTEKIMNLTGTAIRDPVVSTPVVAADGVTRGAIYQKLRNYMRRPHDHYAQTTGARNCITGAGDFFKLLTGRGHDATTANKTYGAIYNTVWNCLATESFHWFEENEPEREWQPQRVWEDEDRARIEAIRFEYGCENGAEEIVRGSRPRILRDVSWASDQ